MSFECELCRHCERSEATQELTRRTPGLLRFARNDGFFSLGNSGFSLIELLTTLVIFGILCGFSLSFLPSLQKKNQLQVMANEIKQAIHFAKMEALAHAHTVTLAPLSEQKDWSAGMLLFVDNPNHRNVEKSSLIREWHWQHPGLTVAWHGFESTNYLRFSPNLMTRDANGYFLVEDNTQHKIKLIINRLARVREERQ